MSKKNNRNSTRRHEYVDSNPITLPVRFQRPPTLAEQVARYMGAHQRYQEAQDGHETPEDMDDFHTEDENEPHSPHELVFDPLLNRELPRYEKTLLDQGRARFEKELQSKIQSDRASKEAAAATKKAIDAERKIIKKTKPATPADET